jgi:Rrf2 family iron-sulfur cluster assembly transcriptional regulator
VLLSRTSSYAVRAAIHLADRPEASPLPVGDIAEALGVPRNYLSKILHQLARSGVLVSVRGPGGGFRLARPPERTCLADIVAASEPQRLDRRCLLGRPECSDADPCPAHDSWQSLADAITRFLNDTTLDDLRRRESKTASKRSRARVSGAK